MTHCCNFAGKGEPAAPPAAQWSGGRGPAARQGGGRLPPRASAQIKIIFIYI